MRITEAQLANLNRHKGERFPCADCGKVAIRRGPSQRFCEPCSAARDVARKVRWQAAHARSPYDPAKAAARRVEVVAERRELGAEASEQGRADMWWPLEIEPPEQYHHTVRVKVPFTYKASKNAIWSMGARQGHVFARRASVDFRATLALAIKQGSGRVPWHEGKVWIDLMVEKPNMRGDAVNVLDLVCDAVKDAIGVDDRWFSIRCLDWRVVKRDPFLFVGVSQSITEPHRACSCCGQVKPLTQFGSNKSCRLGRARECRECLTVVERERTKRRTAARGGAR